MTPPAKERRSALLALGTILALALGFFWKIALTNRVLVGVDLSGYFYPYRDYVSEALRSGRLPLWNPYLFMGAPLLANSQAAVLYPPHWPLLWLSTPKQIAWSIVLHIGLAGFGTYLFGRRALGLRPLPAWVAAVTFAFGGFVGAQVEHVNQLNASAWLPWLLLLVEETLARQRLRVLPLLSGAAVVALLLLAGHTQAAYITLAGSGIYALCRAFPQARQLDWLRGLGALATMAILGVLLAAGQILPTLELSRLSGRAEGLPYNEAASFSLKPSLILKAFLPPLVWEPPFSEYVAYIGLIGLGLAITGSLVAVHVGSGKAANPSRDRSRMVSPEPGYRQRRALLVLALAGVFLAFGAYNPVYYLLYRIVPGFDLFRAPARWLLLFAFGAAVLAGVGLQTLPLSRRWKPAIALLVALELFVAGRTLAYNHPTAPLAFDSMRTAPAHLLAQSAAEPFRFLSMSDIRYDPGDMADLQQMIGSQLPEKETYDLLVATKMKEVLAYNLPLRYRLQCVDGYDGGLLPTAAYLTVERLFLAEDEIWSDGRLRQQLRQIPPARLLSLLNIKYVITDKTKDAWIGGVFYDLEHDVAVDTLVLAGLPAFEATHLGVVSYLTGTVSLADGTAVAQVSIATTNGITTTRILRAGQHSAERVYVAGRVAHQQPQAMQPSADNPSAADYVALIGLGAPSRPKAISFTSLLPPGGRAEFHLRGLTLIDERSGTSRSLSVEPVYRLVHSGDVKIYENSAVLPRTYVVHQHRTVADAAQALALLADPAFDPAREAVFDTEPDLPGLPHADRPASSVISSATVLTYQPELVRISAKLSAPGYLILTDADYPGWVAEVDDQPAPILRANLYFRGVALDPGEHQVAFRFEPLSVRLGLAVAAMSWLAWFCAVAMLVRRIGRKSVSQL